MEVCLQRPHRRVGVIACALLLVGAAAGCGGDAEESTEPSVADGPAEQRVTTRDEVLTAILPTDLVVHRHSDAILATSADGAQRMYLRHRPEDTLPRVVARSKDSLVARGWKVTQEQHLENAVLLESRIIQGKRPVVRGVWFVERDHRILECEVIEPEHRTRQLIRSLKRLCQLVRMTPGPAPAAEP